MPDNYINSSNRANGVSATLTADYPTGPEAGAVAVALLNFGGGTGITLSNIPTGYVAVPSTRIDSTTTFGNACYYKILDGSESGSITWTLSGAQNNSSFIVIYRGCEIGAGGPINTSNSQANASSTATVAPSITPTVPNCALLYFGTVAAVATFGSDGAMRELQDVNSSEFADQQLDAAAATGTRTATASSAAVNVGILIALAPRIGRGMMMGAG